MNNIGDRIASFRKDKQMTQEELAQVLGLTSQAVSKWENSITCPDIQLLVPLANLFDVSVDDLLGNEKKREVYLAKKEDMDQLILKIIVDSNDGDRVRINLPIQLVKIALNIGSKIPQITDNEYLHAINFDDILQLVESGVMGKLVEVDSKEGDHVVIVVE